MSLLDHSESAAPDDLGRMSNTVSSGGRGAQRRATRGEAVRDASVTGG